MYDFQSMHFVNQASSNMTQHNGKRKPDTVDLTTDDASNRVPKTSRTGSFDPQTITSGQRFGETEDFIPLNQLSQVDGAEDEDAQAAELVQSTQDSGESSMGDYILYGMHLCSSQVKRLIIP